MILVDTSVWIDHFRLGDKVLRDLLHTAEVAIHPFIIGELACGNLRNRTEILQLLSELPQVTIAEHEEVLRLVDRKHLFGLGIGWIDAHLVASSLLTRTKLLTRDKPLLRVAANLGIGL